MIRYPSHQAPGLQTACQSQGVQYLLLPHGPAGDGALVQQRQRVAQAAVGQPRQQGRPLGLQVDPLPLRHIAQPPGDVRRQDALKGKLLASGFDGGRYLVQLRGG